jgi:hypothetical protein
MATVLLYAQLQQKLHEAQALLIDYLYISFSSSCLFCDGPRAVEFARK